MLWQAGGGRRQAASRGCPGSTGLAAVRAAWLLNPCLSRAWLQTKSASRAQSNNPPKSSSPLQPEPATGMARGDGEKPVSREWFKESALNAALSRSGTGCLAFPCFPVVPSGSAWPAAAQGSVETPVLSKAEQPLEEALECRAPNLSKPVQKHPSPCCTLWAS